MLRAGLILSLAILAGTVHAHHSSVAIFDSNKTIEITGTVKFVTWRNPHGRLLVEQVDASGEIVEWEAEMPGVSIMRNRGYEYDVIAVGDEITIAGLAPRRPVSEILALNILLPNGSEFDFGSGEPYFAAGKSGNLAGRPTEDAEVDQAIASADGLYRAWSTVMHDPESFPLFKGGYPLNGAGENALAEWDPLDNELLLCGTKPLPLIMVTPFPIDFVQEGENILMRIEEFDSRRLIHMSKDAVAPEEHTQFGFSLGHWDGDALVVETDHIAAGHFDMDGVMQSDQISVVERFSPVDDYKRLNYRITVTDPVYFNEPFELTRYFAWEPTASVHPYECLERY
jgi:hypothetical protein